MAANLENSELAIGLEKVSFLRLRSDLKAFPLTSPVSEIRFKLTPSSPKFMFLTTGLILIFVGPLNKIH